MGRWAVKRQKDQRPGDGQQLGGTLQMHLVTAHIGGLGQRGKGGPARGQWTLAQLLGPWRVAMEGACPATGLPARLIRRQGQGSHLPSVSTGLSSWVQQRHAAHRGPRPESSLFLTPAFGLQTCDRRGSTSRNDGASGKNKELGKCALLIVLAPFF